MRLLLSAGAEHGLDREGLADLHLAGRVVSCVVLEAGKTLLERLRDERESVRECWVRRGRACGRERSGTEDGARGFRKNALVDSVTAVPIVKPS